MVSPNTNPKPTKPLTLSVIGEVLSQLLNVPMLSGALVTFIFFKLPTDLPNRVGGLGWALLFICFIVLRLIDAPRIFEALAVNYTLITLGLIVFNLILRYKASGHAAGVAGPVAAMLYFFGLIATPLASLIPLTIFARIATKGHNFWELVTGSVMSMSITVLTLFLYGFNPLSPFQ